MNIQQDITDAYNMAQKLIHSDFYNSAKGTIEYLRTTASDFPEFEEYALNCASELERALEKESVKKND